MTTKGLMMKLIISGINKSARPIGGKGIYGHGAFIRHSKVMSGV
jgi:hypothetical protein